MFFKCQLLLNDIYTQKMLEWIVSECKTISITGYQTLYCIILKNIEDPKKLLVTLDMSAHMYCIIYLN